ncbi:hypothetical protein HN814_01335, partial [Candidatus Woesearchaeota archaeon]|nr:hypothetical protein [Candidatus Woesearchaeota archaeon]
MKLRITKKPTVITYIALVAAATIGCASTTTNQNTLQKQDMTPQYVANIATLREYIRHNVDNKKIKKLTPVRDLWELLANSDSYFEDCIQDLTIRQKKDASNAAKNIYKVLNMYDPKQEQCENIAISDTIDIETRILNRAISQCIKPGTPKNPLPILSR